VSIYGKILTDEEVLIEIINRWKTELAHNEMFVEINEELLRKVPEDKKMAAYSEIAKAQNQLSDTRKFLKLAESKLKKLTKGKKTD